MNVAFAADGHREADHDDSGHEESGHEEGGREEENHEEEQSVKLTSRQREVAGIAVKAIQLQGVADVVNAPGEIMLNEYKTTSVTPRVSAQVVERQTKLGDSVSTGHPLVTLTSVEMATAQGDLLVSHREWLRVKKLGRKVVSARRYTEARVNHEQAKARVLAYGMSSAQADEFMKSGDATQANGTFQLLSSQSGTVIADKFIVGELIEPGRALFVISDESSLWVEAKLTSTQAALVSTGSKVNVIAGNRHFPGVVVQLHHALDEDTRTLGVRIEVANPEDELHPGVFVQVQINSNSSSEQVLAVPVDAVLRSPDGDWVVFTEHETGEFEPQEIEFVRTVGNLIVIEGIAPGTRVVTSGAFFVQSELAKAGFSIHNH
ncbi:MAG: efflux RND transporter periplasmic adaptor subunit [Gammaproteobacteria bacterium]|nr:efflux RND transporter periplasmic adaptor subunit [Gammaproteobacteria bacterium]